MTHLQIINNKIVTNELLSKFLAFHRFKNKKIVFTNGCFDIIHQGHLDYLAKAADLGEVLVIGLNTDASIHRIKGDSRPIIDEKSRAMLLASLHFVSFVCLFDEETPINLINLVQPDVLVKGADYKPENIVGYDVVINRGGIVETIEFLPGFSTTNIINRIKEIC